MYQVNHVVISPCLSRSLLAERFVVRSGNLPLPLYFHPNFRRQVGEPLPQDGEVQSGLRATVSVFLLIYHSHPIGHYL